KFPLVRPWEFILSSSCFHHGVPLRQFVLKRAHDKSVDRSIPNRGSRCDSFGTDFQSSIWQHSHYQHEFKEKPESVLWAAKRFLVSSRSKVERVDDMLGLLAAVLIILWLLGFFAFHVTTGFIHIVLVVGLILLIFHFLRGRSAT